MSRRNWIGTLSLLPTLWLPNFSLAADPAPAAPLPSATESATQPAVPLRAETFDLRGDMVRNIVRATAAAQSGSYRLLPEARKPNLAAALSQARPAPRPEATPRLPIWQREESSCDGFISCGIDSLLGYGDNDEKIEQFHMRQQKDRLMNQGSFTDSDKDIFKRPW